MQRKSHTTAIILSVLLGGLGIDRFYLGYTGLGVLKLLTGGCFGILYIIDIVNIATKKLQPEDGLGYEEDYQRNLLYGQMNQTQTSTPQSSSNISAADEIIKYKELLEMGAISEEEFTKKKREILGM